MRKIIATITPLAFTAGRYVVIYDEKTRRISYLLPNRTEDYPEYGPDAEEFAAPEDVVDFILDYYSPKVFNLHFYPLPTAYTGAHIAPAGGGLWAIKNRTAWLANSAAVYKYLPFCFHSRRAAENTLIWLQYLTR